MKDCDHFYKEYRQYRLPPKRIQLRCSSSKGCGELLKEGYLFKESDYRGNNLSIKGERIVWDDGTLQDY